MKQENNEKALQSKKWFGTKTLAPQQSNESSSNQVHKKKLPCCKNCKDGVGECEGCDQNCSSDDNDLIHEDDIDDHVDYYINKYSGTHHEIRDNDHLNKKKYYHSGLDEINKPRNSSHSSVHKSVGNIIEAMVRPDLYPDVAFPSLFSTPGIAVSMNASFDLKTNANRFAWLEVNFGQFLTQASYVASVSGATQPFGLSNVFTSTTTSIFDGTSRFIQGTTDKAWIEARQDLVESISNSNTQLFNAVRAGPACITYDFSGRLDIAAGSVTAGIDYSFASDANNVNAPNGFLPDINFLTIKAVEDCAVKYKGNILDSFRACFVPQDETALFLRAPNGGNQNIQQRFYLIVSGAEPNTTIGKITITMNFECKPNPNFSNIIPQTLTRTVDSGHYNWAVSEMFKRGLIISRTTDSVGYGLNRFNSLS